MISVRELGPFIGGLSRRRARGAPVGRPVDQTTMERVAALARRYRMTRSGGPIFEVVLWVEALSGTLVSRARRPQAASVQVVRAPYVHSSSKSRGLGETALDLVLWAGALAGALAIVATVGATVLGFRPIIVQSGSMKPSIPTGAVIVAREVDPFDLAAGDVVSIVRPDGIRVTHRVQSIALYGSEGELTLKGDANDKPDATPLRVRKAQKVVFSISGIGFLSKVATSPLGGFGLGAVITAGFLLPRVASLRRRGAVSV